MGLNSSRECRTGSLGCMAKWAVQPCAVWQRNMQPTIPGVRGVINSVRAPGVDLEAEDQRFLQPVIGEQIYFRDGLLGIVQRVIINPNNRRVVAMVVRGRYS